MHCVPSSGTAVEHAATLHTLQQPVALRVEVCWIRKLIPGRSSLVNLGVEVLQIIRCYRQMLKRCREGHVALSWVGWGLGSGFC
jgi:hypothetical protein